MKRYWIAAISVILVIWSLFPTAVGAQEGQVQVTSDPPYPLLINGEEISHLPAIVLPGSQVCILTNPGYISEVERLVFESWSHGPREECVILTEPGEYIALYTHQVLIQVRSEVRAYRVSAWVPKGGPVALEVLEVVEESPGVRFLFEEWTSGKDPFSPDNVIVPNRPITVEVRWRKQYFLKLEAPEGIGLVGSGWHDARQTVVLKAPAMGLAPAQDERLQFVRWDDISNPAIIIPNRQQPTTSFRLDDTHKIRAVYQTEYLVTVHNPLGTIQKEWVPNGGELIIDTPGSIDIVPEQERYSFKGWEGADLKSAKGSIVVDGPTRVDALYDRQFMVKVESPYGVSGDGWHTEGRTANIKVPENPSSLLFLKKEFAGFSNYPEAGPTLDIPVTEPLTISATYSTQVEVKILSIIVGAIVAIGVIYLVTQMVYRHRREMEELYGPR